MTASEKALEAKLRRALYKSGYSLEKSRKRVLSCDDCGGYRIVDPYYNRVECGERFDMSLEDVRSFVES